MSKYIFLLKNKEVEIKSNFIKFLKNNFYDIKYLLIPISNHSFIMHKPMDYMVQFHHAIIKFQMCILHDDLISYLSNPTEKEITDITDVIEYLHSLNRLSYCNKLNNSSESQCYERMEFSEFKIEIFDKDNNQIYLCNMNLQTERGRFGPIEILEKVKKIYKPIEKMKDKYIYVDTEWGFERYPKSIHNLYGLLHPYTKSMSFYKFDYLQKLLDNVRTMYFCVSVYNSEIIDDEECESKSMSFADNVVTAKDCNWAIRIFDFWTNDISTYLEFIEYNYYIRSSSKLISELNDFNKVKNTYKATISYEIELLCKKGHWSSLKRYVGNDDEISIENILNQI